MAHKVIKAHSFYVFFVTKFVSRSFELGVSRAGARTDIWNKNEWLTQGLIGVFTFSTVETALGGEGTAARCLKLTSQYLSSTHKSSLVKRQSLTPFKLTDLEKFLRSDPKGVVQDYAHEKMSGQSGPTDEGLSSDVDSLEDSPDAPFEDNAVSEASQPNSLMQVLNAGNNKRKGGTFVKNKFLNSRRSSDVSKAMKPRGSIKTNEPRNSAKAADLRKEAPALEVPVYLKEIEKICFPGETPFAKKVVLDKESKMHLLQIGAKKQFSGDQSLTNQSNKAAKQQPLQLNAVQTATKFPTSTSFRMNQSNSVRKSLTQHGSSVKISTMDSRFDSGFTSPAKF